MPFNYEEEKQKFFETYNFKVGDKICIPMRNNTQWEITAICPKVFKIVSLHYIDEYGPTKKHEHYTSNNRYKDWQKPYIIS
jgi:3D (Asp-Asp-Asp) domain-containing protein